MEPTPQNAYAPASSAAFGDSEPKAAISSSAKLYTPAQIRAGSFLGGPIAAVYLLRQNFRVLDRGPEARTTVVWGVAFVAGLMALLPFLLSFVVSACAGGLPPSYCMLAPASSRAWDRLATPPVDAAKMRHDEPIANEAWFGSEDGRIMACEVPAYEGHAEHGMQSL